MKAPVLRAEGHVVVGLGQDRGLAGNGVAQDAEAVLGADHEGVEAVEILQRFLQSLAEARAFLHAPGEIAGRHLGIVLGLELDAAAAHGAAQGVVIGERPVVHQALVAPRRERMRTLGRHRQLGRHARVRDAVRARHLRQLEACAHRVRPSDFLVDLHARAGADDGDAVALARNRRARLLLQFRWQREHRVRAMQGNVDGRARRRRQPAGERTEIIVRAWRAQRQLHMSRIALTVDCEAGAVGTTLAHGRQHACHQFAELRLEGGIFEKESDYSAHVRNTPVVTRKA